MSFGIGSKSDHNQIRLYSIPLMTRARTSASFFDIRLIGETNDQSIMLLLREEEDLPRPKNIVHTVKR